VLYLKFLRLDNLGNCCIVIFKIAYWLAIIQIYQHVCYVWVQLRVLVALKLRRVILMPSSSLFVWSCLLILLTVGVDDTSCRINLIWLLLTWFSRIVAILIFRILTAIFFVILLVLLISVTVFFFVLKVLCSSTSHY